MRHGRRKPGPAEPSAFPTRPYDLLKEVAVALVVVAVLTAGLAALFSSPDEPPVTLGSWSRADPAGFTATAVSELGGTSATATYGPPYNHTAGAAQKIGPVSLQQWAGVRIPIDTADDFVIQPLQRAPEPAPVSQALAIWQAASPDQQQAWTSAYSDALGKAPNGDPAQVASGDYGPVPVLTARLQELAQSGALDGELLTEKGQFYQTDYTRPLLFLGDGDYFAGLAQDRHLAGDQWGMMNETGNYPGQPWLWLYTFWYQIEPFKSSGNADALIWALMALLSLALVLVPFIPGIRSIPRWTRVHRLIWRDYYRTQQRPPH
jgi:hypothetical protein